MRIRHQSDHGRIGLDDQHVVKLQLSAVLKALGSPHDDAALLLDRQRYLRRRQQPKPAENVSGEESPPATAAASNNSLTASRPAQAPTRLSTSRTRATIISSSAQATCGWL